MLNTPSSTPLEQSHPMLKRYYPAALLVLALCLGACSSNYKYSDADYRPLGDPAAVNRGTAH